MYAVIKTGGKQYRVQQGDVLRLGPWSAVAWVVPSRGASN